MNKKEQDEVYERLKLSLKERKRESKEVAKDWPPAAAVAKRWEAHGMDCCVARGTAALCGYVKVPLGHPCHGKYYDEIDESISVHGGLTFSQLAKDGTWFGFDCGHAGDFTQIEAPSDSPASREALKDDGSLLFPIIHPGEIWTVEDVSDEVENLAKQLAEIMKCA